MRPQMLKLIAGAIIVLIFTPQTGDARERQKASPGLSGRLQGGALFIQTNSQLSTEESNRRTADRNGPADAHHKAIPMASVYLRYQCDDDTAIYAGNPLEVGEGLAMEAGIHQSTDAGTLDMALTWRPTKTVWKNPYQTVEAREETDQDVYGLHLQWEEVAGTPFEIDYKIDRIHIENDEIGDLERDLRRSGQTHELGVKYNIPSQSSLRLTPELSYTYGDIHGHANHYQGVKVGVLLKQAKPPWILIGLLSGSHTQYQKRHPLFGKSRQESGITTFAQAMRLHLFGVKRLFLSVGAGYLWSDANIDFYDSQTLIGLTNLGINF